MKNEKRKSLEAVTHTRGYLANRKGITLIALIITIIVMLMLVGISISLLLGEDGIITKAQGTKQEQESATEIEQIKAELAGYIIKGNGKLDISLFGEDKKIKVNVKEYDVVEDENINNVYEIVKDEDNGYIVKIKKDTDVPPPPPVPPEEQIKNEYYYTENADGTITVTGPKKVRVQNLESEEAQAEIARLIDKKFGEGTYNAVFVEGTVEDEEFLIQLEYYYCCEITSLLDTSNSIFWSTVELAESQIGSWTLGDLGEYVALVDVTSPLPSTIDGKTVTAIGSHAFDYVHVHSSNFIPNTVKIIGDSAFRHSFFRKQLIIPDSVEVIEDDAFGRLACEIDAEFNAKNVELIMNDANNNLKSIGRFVFESDDFIVGTINLRKEVSVGDYGFEETSVIVNYK